MPWLQVASSSSARTLVAIAAWEDAQPAGESLAPGRTADPTRLESEQRPTTRRLRKSLREEPHSRVRDLWLMRQPTAQLRPQVMDDHHNLL